MSATFETDWELAETPDDDTIDSVCSCDRNDPHADLCEHCSEEDAQ